MKNLNKFHKRFHNYHILPPSVWPIVVSSSILLILLSLVKILTLSFGTVNVIELLIGVIMLFVIVFAWLDDVFAESYYAHTSIVKLGLILGFILFIVSEIMLFASFFWAYFHMKLKGGFLTEYMFPAFPVQGVTLQTGIGNTIILILSGFFLSLVLASLTINNRKNTTVFLSMGVLGITKENALNNMLTSPFDNFVVDVYDSAILTSITVFFFIILASLLYIRIFTKVYTYVSLQANKVYQIHNLFYHFVYNSALEVFGLKSILNKLFPILFGNFYFLLFANLWGLINSAFSITGHIYFTFSLGMYTFVYSIILGLKMLNLDFFSILTPHNCPRPLLPLLFPIEALSYTIRPVSLSVRLFANILAGHILMHIIGGSIKQIFNITVYLSFLICFILIIILELMVACIQAFIFFLLSNFYIVENLTDKQSHDPYIWTAPVVSNSFFRPSLVLLSDKKPIRKPKSSILEEREKASKKFLQHVPEANKALKEITTTLTRYAKNTNLKRKLLISSLKDTAMALSKGLSLLGLEIKSDSILTSRDGAKVKVKAKAKSRPLTQEELQDLDDEKKGIYRNMDGDIMYIIDKSKSE